MQPSPFGTPTTRERVTLQWFLSRPVSLVGRRSALNAGDAGSILGQAQGCPDVGEGAVGLLSGRTAECRTLGMAGASPRMDDPLQTVGSV